MEYLNVRQVVEKFPFTPHQLASWRSRKSGPPWYKIGKYVCYREDEIRRWIEERRQ